MGYTKTYTTTGSSRHIPTWWNRYIDGEMLQPMKHATTPRVPDPARETANQAWQQMRAGVARNDAGWDPR